MKGKATFLGHPIHPMLIVLPLGLLPAASLCDVVALVTGKPFWGHMSFWLIAGGIVGGLIAAVFGFIDWWSIPNGTRAKRIGIIHATINIVVLLLFGVSLSMRSAHLDTSPSGVEATLGFAAIALAVISGWLGGELVYRLGIGVDDAANPNASDSLTDRTFRPSA